MMDAPAPLPTNLEAEQALLGAIMLNNDAFHLASGIVKAEHFSEPLHGDMFAACGELIAKGRQVTPISLTPYVPEIITDGVTGKQYLSRLYSDATTVINAPDFATAIKDAALRRNLIQVADEVSASAREFDPSITATDIAERAEQALYIAVDATDSGRRPISSARDAAREAMEMATAAYQRDGGLSGLPTGLFDLDRLMGGLQNSDLVILAARPGLGKTSLATNIAYHVAKDGMPVLFFSLEMSAEQLATRVLSEQTGIPSSDIRRGEIKDWQFTRLADVADTMAGLPLEIDDNGGITIGQLCQCARRMHRLKAVGMIVVDYIQLLSGTTKRSGENRVQEVTEITTKLKALAKEINVPVLALSQLSRQVESRDDKHPQLSDLRESGSIEQDADVVLFIYREEYYLRQREPKEGTDKHFEWERAIEAAHGRAEVIVAKQRHGPTGTVQLQFEANLTRFANLAREAYLPERTS